MVHTLSIWLLVAGFFGPGLFNAIGTQKTKGDFARWGYRRWWSIVRLSKLLRAVRLVAENRRVAGQ
jgi:hypothetical protein